MTNSTITKRYICRDDEDGRSTIVDIFTGLPAEVHGRALPRVQTVQADQMLLTLNMLDRYRLSLA